jgi:hypothetical protein
MQKEGNKNCLKSYHLELQFSWEIFVLYFLFVLFLVVLKFKFRALCFLRRHSIT